MGSWFHNFSRRMGMILGSPTPWIFLWGLLAIGLITNAASNILHDFFDSLLHDWLINANLSADWITIICGVILIIIVLVSFDLPKLLRRWVGRAPNIRMISDTSTVPRYRGLITMVSSGPNIVKLPAYVTLCHHLKTGIQDKAGLEYGWLLAGPGTGEFSSIANAEKLKQEFLSKGVKEIFIVALKDADNPQEVFDAVNGIYTYAQKALEISSDELISDYTGGTKSMTFGLALACADHGWPLGFLKPDKYDADGRPSKDAKSEPRRIDVTFYSDIHSPQ